MQKIKKRSPSIDAAKNAISAPIITALEMLVATSVIVITYNTNPTVKMLEIKIIGP